jgi:N-acyl-D-amino-acid deacylase
MRRADLAIDAGRIVAIGHVTNQATAELDATGWVVAPGFIDVHTHADDVDEHPDAENFLRMGVTTLVVGNCGGSVQDVHAFFQHLEATSVAPNVATFIGHNTLRRHVMGGSFMRPPTEAELGQMRDQVDQAMAAGALGLSTGLIYLPGTYSKTEELVELAKVASQHHGMYVSHMRSEGLEIFPAIEEVIRIAREARIKAHISHIKLSSPRMWSRASEVIALIEKARASGLDITQDQYLYTASSTGMSQLIPDEAREGGHFKERLKDPAAKAAMISRMKQRLLDQNRPDYAYAVIASCASDPRLNGLNVAQAAKLRRGSDSLEDQIETVLEIEREGGASGIFHGISEDDLRSFLRHTNTMIASDSGIRRMGEAVPHPRGYGNNARAIARYVRDEPVLRLEEMVRRMTQLPARHFGFQDRGELRVGAWADVAVFDPATVQDLSTYNDPHHWSVGFRHVLVNGTPVIREHQKTGARPGKALRRLNQP